VPLTKSTTLAPLRRGLFCVDLGNRNCLVTNEFGGSWPLGDINYGAPLVGYCTFWQQEGG
jgi:hypothetical protein